MHCPHCGHAHDEHILLNERRDDVEDVLRQAAEAGGDFGRLLRVEAESIRSADRSVDAFNRLLNRIYRDIVRDLRRLARDGDARTRAALLRARESDIHDLIRLTGALDLSNQWQVSLDEMDGLALQREAVQGLNPTARAVDLEALQTVLEHKTRAANLAKEVLGLPGAPATGRIVPATRVIEQGLRSALTLERLDDAIGRIQRDLAVKRPQAVTLARTELAEYDRANSEATAARYGIKAHLYVGPRDGLTRPFCRALLLTGRWWPQDMILRLDNGQGGSGPLFSGGGYNCRHRWVPVVPEIVEERKLKRATLATVREVNASAGKSKSRRR